jgi:cAMP-dependent protein kinase regulator
MGCCSSSESLDYAAIAQVKERNQPTPTPRSYAPNNAVALPFGTSSANRASQVQESLDHFLMSRPNLYDVASKASDYASSKIKSGVTVAHHLKNVFAAPLQFADDFKAPVFPKTPAEKEFIVLALKKNFVFSNLTTRETEILVDAFERQEVKANDFIIQQGDAGDFFYVLLNGDCLFIVNEKVVGKASRGQTFGELALLYKSPRAASVQAESFCTLFRVDQTTFRYILQTQTEQAENDKRDLIKAVPFFQELVPDDVTKLVSTMRPRPFTEGEYLVKKGEEGDAFYLIQEGQVKVSDITVGAVVYQDQTLGPGDYFGERALVTHEPRTANCIALTNGIALVIDQPTFNTVLGNLTRLILKSQDKQRLVRPKI